MRKRARINYNVWLLITIFKHLCYMQDIIEYLLNQYDPTFLYLDSLFESVLAGKSGPDLRAWVDENRRVLEVLLNRLDEIPNEYLRANLLSLLPVMQLEESQSILMSTAGALANDLAANGGYLSPARLAESLALCDAALEIGENELMEALLSLVEESKQQSLIRRATRAARALGR